MQTQTMLHRHQQSNSSITIDGLSGRWFSITGVVSVGVDDSSIEISSDELNVKAGGVTNGMLAGSISNDKLAGSIGKLITIQIVQ